MPASDLWKYEQLLTLITEARIEELKGQVWPLSSFMDLYTYNEQARHHNRMINERIAELMAQKEG